MMPAIKALEAKRNNKTLRSCLHKNLGFSGLNLDAAIDYLIETRRNQIIAEFIEKIGGQQRAEKLRNLLSRPIDELYDLFQKYRNYRKAIEISEKYDLALIDPHASWLKQRRMAKSVKKDRRNVRRYEKRRCRQIEREITDLFANNRLLTDIVNKKWSFVEILDLARQYQKRLGQKDVSPAHKIAVFEEITAEFRRRDTENLAAGKTQLGLRELRAIGDGVYNLLSEVFDMDNASRNRLMTEIRQHNSLLNEWERLLIARQNREIFFQQSQQMA
jgi:hypothetical protein